MAAHKTSASLALRPSAADDVDTQAAAEFALNENAMRRVLADVSPPDGTIRAFEILLETHGIASDAPSAHVIASRYSDR